MVKCDKCKGVGYLRKDDKFVMCICQQKEIIRNYLGILYNYGYPKKKLKLSNNSFVRVSKSSNFKKQINAFLLAQKRPNFVHFNTQTVVDTYMINASLVDRSKVSHVFLELNYALFSEKFLAIILQLMQSISSNMFFLIYTELTDVELVKHYGSDFIDLVKSKYKFVDGRGKC